ncbi:MAG TPA: hypothetical protein VK400_15850 [Pyrinomonadaceae bacterium]|nr:hypothetical protein [Pyrinomonadaceae bacterium]
MKIRFVKLSAAFFVVALLSTACGQLGGGGADETAQTNPYPQDARQAEAVYESADVRYARENLDLRAVGALLQRADNAEEFEYLLNSEGVNNLDLNRDGSVDYISVSEFEDRSADDERGLSLFSRFGPDLIQQIATIIFDRDGGMPDADGARILLTGDERLYGDDYHYETDWVDRSLSIVRWLYDDRRDDSYSSPYYYENYPENYEVYQPVETPVYRSRIERIYSDYVAATPAPVFIQTSNPTVVTNVKIKSPYDGRSVAGNDFPKPAKLPKEQKRQLDRNNPVIDSPDLVTSKKGKIKDVPPGFGERRQQRQRGNPNVSENPRKFDSPRFERREKPDNSWKEAVKAAKAQRPAANPQPRKPDKVERQIMKQQQQFRTDNNGGGGGKQKGGGNNPGNGNGGGGGKGNGGGGGKGGGKKN